MTKQCLVKGNPFSGTCPACSARLNGLPAADRAISKPESLLDLSQLNPGFVILSPRICLCRRLTKWRTQSTPSIRKRVTQKYSFVYCAFFRFLHHYWKFTLKVVLAMKPLRCEVFKQIGSKAFEIWGEMMLTMRPLESRSLISLPSSCQEEDGA